MQAEKTRIRAAFAKAAPLYDSVAHVQRQIALRLITLCPALPNTPSTRLLDAGCGTGYGLQQLAAHYPHAQRYGIDLALNMARHAKSICADLECLPIGQASVHLYFSSLAWQWAEPARASAEAARVLAPGGALRVATLSHNTLHELRSAFAAADDHQHVRQFASTDNYRLALAGAGFEHILIEQETLTVHLATLPALLHELRTLGANLPGPQGRRGLLTPAALRRVEAHYEQSRTPQGLPASYDVLYLSAQRNQP